MSKITELRVASDGTACGTVVSADGVEIGGVERVIFEAAPDRGTRARLSITPAKVDAVAGLVGIDIPNEDELGEKIALLDEYIEVETRSHQIVGVALDEDTDKRIALLRSIQRLLLWHSARGR